MDDSTPAASATQPAPQFGIGSLVRHSIMGTGKIVDYDKGQYVVLYPDGQVKRFVFEFQGLAEVKPAGDPAADSIRKMIEDVLGEHGWLDVELELASRWTGGSLVLKPGREGIQAKELPIEMFFKKIIGIRDKLRVLEQKINSHPTLSAAEKVEFQGYITRSYGSLTSFNVLFAAKESRFIGQSAKDESD